MKKTVAFGLIMLLALTSQSALAGKKKKGPKPYKSEEVTIAIAHPIFHGQTGEVNNVTGNEFEQTCATPVSQGLDAHVFEVPAEYQKIQAGVKAIGVPGGPAGYDLDLIFYDANCAEIGTSLAAGTDESGYMPAGSSWILMYNYLGDPATKGHIELAPLTT